MQLDLHAIAHALGGRAGGDKVYAPGPGHSAADRSLVVRINNDGSDIVVYSFAGDDWRVCRNYVREKLGLPAFHPGQAAKKKVRYSAPARGAPASTVEALILGLQARGLKSLQEPFARSRLAELSKSQVSVIGKRLIKRWKWTATGVNFLVHLHKELKQPANKEARPNGSLR